MSGEIEYHRKLPLYKRNWAYNRRGLYQGRGGGVVGVISIIKHIVTQLATILVVAGKASLLKLLFLIIKKKIKIKRIHLIF